ncbi:MAG: T9SS type A sorting domain-containing protein [Aureispira sp.]
MKWFAFIILIILLGQVSAQTITFNKRFKVGCANTVLTSLELTDSCHYITGIARDTINCRTGALFIRLDSFGSVIDYKIHLDSLSYYETWDACLRKDWDGNFIIAGEFFDTTNILQAAVIKYDPHGNILWKKKHGSFFSMIQPGFLPEDIVIAKDSNYILAGETYEGLQLFKLDRNGDTLWTRRVDCNNNYCFQHSIVPLDDGFVVGYNNSDVNQISFDYTLLCVLTKYDYQGNELWTWQNDSSVLLIGAEDLIQTKDKGWVVASGIGKETFNSDGITTRLSFDGYVFKLDSNRNRVWATPLRAHSYSPSGRTIRLIELADSSLMTFGMTADTFRDASNTLRGQYSALVAKLSPDGDSLWGRKYHYFQQSLSRHEIFDAEQTKDGGFLICGQAQGSGQGAYQQGWLLKLDQHGCLVPGCHLPDTTTSILPIQAQPQAQLKLYPNPAVDYLNVWYRNKQVGEELTFRILDAQGRVLQSHTARDISDKTYIFPVWELLRGWYVLEVRQDGVLVGSEVFSIR